MKMKSGMAGDSAPGGPVRDLSALSDWAPELAEAFVRLSSDIALIVGQDGLIEKVAQSGSNPISGATQWVGQSWIDTVTGETRSKIELMLKEVTDTGVGRRREINHPVSEGTAIPIAYTAIRLGVNGPVLAVGRDLRTIAAIQQHFLEVQRETEQVYWRARQAEAHYQLLFRVATDAVLLADGETHKILEANRAASIMFDLTEEELLGRAATAGFDTLSRASLDELMADARSTGKPFEVRVRLAGKLIHTSVSVTPFRVLGSMRLLMRVRGEHRSQIAPSAANENASLGTHESPPVVMTDSGGRILTANEPFLKLVNVGSENLIRKKPLQERLVGGQPIAEIVARVRNEGLVQRAMGTVMQASGKVLNVQISAQLLTDDDQDRIGFTFHASEAPEQQEPLPTLESLSGLIGSADLPDLVRRATVIVERHLISQALRQNAGDVVGAARLLGITSAELQHRSGEAEEAQR